MPRRSRLFVVLTLLALAAVGALAMALGVAPEPLLWFAPAVVLSVPLLGGWFVGERALVARGRQASSRRGVAGALLAASSPSRVGISGGRLIARSLAKRGPPAAVLA